MTRQTLSRPLGARRIASSDAQNALIAGTEVLTLDGSLPVEVLSPGDRIITRDSGAVRLACVGRLSLRRRVIAIAASTLAAGRPEQEVHLLAGQEVLLRDWRAAALFGAATALVPADRLIDGVFVRDLGVQKVSCVTLHFEAPHILYADGVEVACADPLTVPA